MSRKTSIQDLEQLAATRNHTLLAVSNEETPAQGNIELLCKTCGETFGTSTKSYKNARKTGCPNCKAIKARAQVQPAKKASTQTVKVGLTKSSIDGSFDAEALARVQAATSKRILKRANFQKENNVYSGEQLVEFLKKDLNPYNQFMLDKMEDKLPLDAASSQPKQKHHIIPQHAGGPNAQWNWVYLTPEDHCKAHELRYEAYLEYGDYNFLRSLGPEVSARITPNAEFEKQLLAQRQNANQNMRPRFTGDAGGNASKAVLAGLTPEAKKAHRERHQNQMSPVVRDVLQKGATFIHNTGVVFNLQPYQAPTLTELKDLLAAQLPVGNADRISLEKATKPINITTNIGKVIKGTRPTAYGWRLQR